MIHYSPHADQAVTDRYYPMVEFNGFTIYDDGNRTSLGFDGVDLVNLGGTNAGTVLTVAGGLRYLVMGNILVGTGVEKSLARDDILDWRSYVDLVLAF